MVLIKLRCTPGSEQATIGVRVTTAAPSLSLSQLKSKSTEPILNIRVHLRCLSSMEPSRAITILTSGTIFDNAKPTEGYMDNLALGMLGAGLVCKSGEETKNISLGFFKVHRARQDGDDASDLRQRPRAAFVTVPSLDSGEEVSIDHALTSDRLFVYSDNLTAENLTVGEKYSINLRDDYVGTTWWCWGALDGNLRGKKLHAFSEGICMTGMNERPTDAEIEAENWVCGEDISQLVFVTKEDEGHCSIQVTE